MNKRIKQIGCSVLIIIIVVIGVYFYSLLNAFLDIATGPSGRSIENFENTPVYEFAQAIDDDDVDRLKCLLENKPSDLDINYILTNTLEEINLAAIMKPMLDGIICAFHPADRD